MGLIYTVFLEHRLVCQSEALPCRRRGGVSAALAEATSAGINIVDDHSTITHTDGTFTFSILRCGFYMDLFYLFLFAFITHLSRSYMPCTIMHGASHRLICSRL